MPKSRNGQSITTYCYHRHGGSCFAVTAQCSSQRYDFLLISRNHNSRNAAIVNLPLQAHSRADCVMGTGHTIFQVEVQSDSFITGLRSTSETNIKIKKHEDFEVFCCENGKRLKPSEKNQFVSVYCTMIGPGAKFYGKITGMSTTGNTIFPHFGNKNSANLLQFSTGTVLQFQQNLTRTLFSE